MSANRDFNLKRRELLCGDLNKQYASLCNPSVPVSSYLFGDDLNKEVEDLTKANKLSNKVTSKQRAEPYQIPRGCGFKGIGRCKQSSWKGRGHFLRIRPGSVLELSELSELSKLSEQTAATTKKPVNEVCENSINLLIKPQSPFRACKLQNFIDQWRNVTSDPFIHDAVCHCHIDFEKRAFVKWQKSQGSVHFQ